MIPSNILDHEKMFLLEYCNKNAFLGVSRKPEQQIMQIVGYGHK